MTAVPLDLTTQPTDDHRPKSLYCIVQGESFLMPHDLKNAAGIYTCLLKRIPGQCQVCLRSIFTSM